MKLALFDFDGTLTKSDSLIKFIRFSVGDIKFILGLVVLSPILILYKLKFVTNHKAKQYMISYFFKGMDEKIFLQLSNEFSLKYIDAMLRSEAMKRIAWHKNMGHTIVIVSASIESWLRPWCDKNKIDLIATRIEIKKGKVTGKFSSKNCHGAEKVNRIREKYSLPKYSEVYAYGDSLGDKEMLQIADKKYYQYFH